MTHGANRDPIYAPDGRTWYDTMLAEAEKRGQLEAEIERLRALLTEVRSDINDYGFSDSFADETHKTLANIDIGLAYEQSTREGKENE